MELIDACIVWSSNSDGGRVAGRAVVATVPTPDWTFIYSPSVGSRRPRWTNVTDAERRDLLRGYFTQMVREDEIREDVAREALSVIDDLDPAEIYFVEDKMAVEALALCRAKPAGHFLRLLVARREIIENRVAEDVVARRFDGDVLGVAADHDAELQLIVHDFRVAWPVNRGARSLNDHAIGDVVDRQLSIYIGKRRQWFGVNGCQCRCIVPCQQAAQAAPGLTDMCLEAHAVAHLTRLGQWRKELHRRQRFVELGIASKPWQQVGGLFQSRITAIDQCKHRCEVMWMAGTPTRRGGKIDNSAFAVMDGSDMHRATGISKGRKFHRVSIPA